MNYLSKTECIAYGMEPFLKQGGGGTVGSALAGN
jgi:hypothetical protein